MSSTPKTKKKFHNIKGIIGRIFLGWERISKNKGKPRALVGVIH